MLAIAADKEGRTDQAKAYREKWKALALKGKPSTFSADLPSLTMSDLRERIRRGRELAFA